VEIVLRHGKATVTPVSLRDRRQSPSTVRANFDFARFDEHLQKIGKEMADNDLRVAGTAIDYRMINADEISEVDDAMYRAYPQGNPDIFLQLSGFNVRDFDALYSLASEILEVRKRGRSRTIGPRDSFLLLLHWPRTGASTVRIAISMQLSSDTLYCRLRRLVDSLWEPLVETFTNAAARELFTADGDLLQCGLIVDSTVQYRRRPTRVWEQVRKFFSGKHGMYG
jgi:hypothetical protein